jgi:hypothetical protein
MLVGEEINGSRSFGAGAPGGAWLVDIVGCARHDGRQENKAFPRRTYCCSKKPLGTVHKLTGSQCQSGEFGRLALAGNHTWFILS